jgi:hypothetical protein
MQQIDVPNGDSGFPVALQKFQAMQLADQLPLLAFALQQDLAWKAFGTPSNGRPRRRRVRPPAPAQTAPAAAAELKIIESDFVDARPTLQGSHALRPMLAPAASHRGLSIVITMCAGFTLALATMIWQRDAARISRQVPELPPQNPALAASASPVMPTPIATPLAPTPTPTVEPIVMASHDSSGPMPVTVYFHRRGVHDDPTDRRKVDWLMEGRLTNLSDQALYVEVRVDTANAQGASLVQIGVDPHGQRDFGADDGLRMHPGDKITLVSPPYSNLVVASAH